MSISDLLGVKLQGKGGETNGPTEGIELISLYFSAHWCPPCRGFTPKLAETYNKVNADKKRWEIVFVSLDRTQKDFDSYYGEMPWLTIPFDEDTAREGLASKHGVRGIPALMLLNMKDGSVTTSDGRALIESDPAGNKFPWN